MALNIVYHGTSITKGQEATTDYTDIISASLGVPKINEGHGAYTLNVDEGLGMLLPNFAAHVDAHYSAGDDNIVVAELSTNSFYYSNTVAQEKADVIQYATTARANGWKLVILDVMQRGTEGTLPIADWRTRVAEYNDWMKKNWNSFAHGYVSIHDSSVYSSTPFDGDGNIAFYADSAHPNDDGYVILAPVIEAAILRAADVDTAQEVTMSDTTKRIVRLSAGQVETIYYNGAPRTYELVEGSPVLRTTPTKMPAYVSGS